MKRIGLLPVALAAVLSLAACNANRGATDETATVGTTGDRISAGEIYVRPFPDVNSGRWQVSTTGGVRPLWARSGRELVYVSPAGALMRVGVERAPSWAATTPAMLVKEGYFTNPVLPARMYDIAPDGQRFLMIKNPIGAEQTAASANLIVVQNWLEELKRLVPTN